MTTVITGSFKKTLVQAEYAETQLTSPTTTPPRSVVGYTKAVVSFKVTNINTSVTLRVELSNVGGTSDSDWDNADPLNQDILITQNGTKVFVTDRSQKNFVRDVQKCWIGFAAER